MAKHITKPMPRKFEPRQDVSKILSNKQKAKELAEIIKAVAPIYEKHGKRIAGVILPK